MNILNSMLGSIQESLKSTEATLTSSHPKTSFNPSKSTLQLSSLTTCEPDVRHGWSYSTTRFPRVPYHSLKTSVLYSLRQLCSTTRIWSSMDPLLDPKYESIQVSSAPAATIPVLVLCLALVVCRVLLHLWKCDHDRRGQFQLDWSIYALLLANIDEKHEYRQLDCSAICSGSAHLAVLTLTSIRWVSYTLHHFRALSFISVQDLNHQRSWRARSVY